MWRHANRRLPTASNSVLTRHDLQARFLSRFTRASSGGKAGGSPQAAGNSDQPAKASANGAVGGLAAAGSGKEKLEEGDEQGGTEVLDVDPAKLDRPEGAVGADAPDPEDADPPAAAMMQSEQEANALARAAQREHSEPTARRGRSAASATQAQTAAVAGQAGKDAAEKQPAQARAGEAGGKQRQPAGKKRRQVSSVAPGRRVTRARAGATGRSVQPTEAAAPKESQRKQAGRKPHDATAKQDGAAADPDGVARQRDSSPAASSDCVLLGEANEAEGFSNADSARAQVSGHRTDALRPGSPEKAANGSADASPVQEREHDAQNQAETPVSDSEHSSAMAVEPRFTGDHIVNSGEQAASLAAPIVGDRSSEAATPDPAAVQQVCGGVRPHTRQPCMMSQAVVGPDGPVLIQVSI